MSVYPNKTDSSGKRTPLLKKALILWPNTEEMKLQVTEKNFLEACCFVVFGEDYHDGRSMRSWWRPKVLSKILLVPHDLHHSFRFLPKVEEYQSSKESPNRSIRNQNIRIINVDNGIIIK